MTHIDGDEALLAARQQARATGYVQRVHVMLMAAGTVAGFVDRHPTVKMLALSFLLLIGTNLVAEGFGVHIPKGYTYFAMGFSVMVEMLNLKMKVNARKPVQLHNTPVEPEHQQ